MKPDSMPSTVVKSRRTGQLSGGSSTALNLPVHHCDTPPKAPLASSNDQIIPSITVIIMPRNPRPQLTQAIRQ